MTRNMPVMTFHDGFSMPQLGFGTWQVASDVTADTVNMAIEQGYRLIDGAFIYGNEEGLGEGIRRSGISRGELFLTTKIWNNEHGKGKARISVERSLETIGVDQLDLILIHWPVPEQNLYVETWEALIDMREEGLVRSIGVSNFNADHLQRLIEETEVTPVLNQIEINPALQQPRLLEQCRKLGIVPQAWTPLGNGRSFNSPPIAEVARIHNKSPAQIVLRWHIQMGHSLLARSVKEQRQKENLDIFDFKLSHQEMLAIKTLDVGLRTGPDPSVFKMR